MEIFRFLGTLVERSQDFAILLRIKKISEIFKELTRPFEDSLCRSVQQSFKSVLFLLAYLAHSRKIESHSFTLLCHLRFAITQNHKCKTIKLLQDNIKN